MTIPVLLVDDHKVFVETLATALAATDGIEVIGCASTAQMGLELAERLQPSVALVDLDLPDYGGVELAGRIAQASPKTKVVVLTAMTRPSLFRGAITAGAAGFVLKTAGLSEVCQAVRSVHEGLLVTSRSPPSPPQQHTGRGSDLTPRELQVLALLAEGESVGTVAELLGITWNTCRSYVRNILYKLHAHTQLEAVARANRLGLLKLEMDGAR